MRTAHPLSAAVLAGPRARRQPTWLGRLRARLRSGPLDQDLAAGIIPWRTPAHAARALQLSSARNRRGLARSLEELLKHAEEPLTYCLSAVVPPCRTQVREAKPQILRVAARLRSGEPIDACGIARLADLLSDGGGPCYVATHRRALVAKLQDVSTWLDVHD